MQYFKLIHFFHVYVIARSVYSIPDSTRLPGNKEDFLHRVALWLCAFSFATRALTVNYGKKRKERFLLPLNGR